jgi:prepilin-type N-terminal cleavage/methylation domain-containing protein
MTPSVTFAPPYKSRAERTNTRYRAKSAHNFLEYGRWEQWAPAHCQGIFTTAFRAFSLIELLVVIAIIGVLAAVAVPALSSMTQARTVTDSAYQLADLAELARNEAIARRTYVWLGMQTNAGAGGSSQVLTGMVFSKDGTANLEDTNLQPLGRVQRLERLGLFPPSVVPGAPTDLTAQQAGPGFSIGGTTFSNFILAFTPMGEISLDPQPGPHGGFTPRIGLGLRTMRGSSPDHGNPVDLLLSGSTGLPSVHRP